MTETLDNGTGRYLGERIPGSTIVEIDADDHFVFTDPDWRTPTDQFIDFVAGSRPLLGSIVKSTGDGVLARFDSPSSALAFATEVR
jgi:hypothetical protein